MSRWLDVSLWTEGWMAPRCQYEETPGLGALGLLAGVSLERGSWRPLLGKVPPRPYTTRPATSQPLTLLLLLKVKTFFPNCCSLHLLVVVVVPSSEKSSRTTGMENAMLQHFTVFVALPGIKFYQTLYHCLQLAPIRLAKIAEDNSFHKPFVPILLM